MSNAKAMLEKPFIEHLKELQVRLTWSVAAIVLCSLGAYIVNPTLLELVQQPLGQTLYYTSPIGGFNFIFKLCFVAGVIAALPIILYHFFCFLGPLLKKKPKKLIVTFAFSSFILAVGGVLFGYFISLPAALRILTNVGGQSIQAMITAEEYFNFTLTYIAGFALIFQLPLILLFINSVKPLQPGKMMKMQRYVILFSFILAAILTPTPDPVNQAIMAFPIILLYQMGVALVWLVNKTRAPMPQSPPLAREMRPAGSALGVSETMTAVLNPTPVPQLIESQAHRTVVRREMRRYMDIRPQRRQTRDNQNVQYSPAEDSSHNMSSQVTGRPQVIDLALS